MGELEIPGENIKVKDCLPGGDIKQLKLKIKSTNSFPTASGLASSASGLAALSVCLFDVFHFKEEYAS